MTDHMTTEATGTGKIQTSNIQEQTSQGKSHAILSIGNALVDVLVKLPDNHIPADLGLEYGGMVMIDQDQKNSLQDKYRGQIFSQSAGGSAGNTIVAIGKLGAIPSGFIGCVGTGRNAQVYRTALMEAGVTPHLLTGTVQTGIATTLISPDGQRTFGTYLGAAVQMVPELIDRAWLRQYTHIHVEGYLIFNQVLFRSILKMAKEEGLSISTDVASHNLILETKDFLIPLLKEYVDIIFANEDEASALTGLSAMNSLRVLADWCRIAIVKLGERGSIIQTGGEVVRIRPVKANCIDSTGAGDNYAAGFLSGYLQGKTLEECGNIGSFIGAKVVETYGARLDEKAWKEIRSTIG